MEPWTLTESCFAVHSGSAGTSVLEAEPLAARRGVPGPVQPRMVGEDLIPDRMMKVIRNRLKKCCQPTQAGVPSAPLGGGTAPGCSSMNSCTAGSSRSAWAAADRREQEDEPQRDRPEQVEPPRAPDADVRRRAPTGWARSPTTSAGRSSPRLRSGAGAELLQRARLDRRRRGGGLVVRPRAPIPCCVTGGHAATHSLAGAVEPRLRRITSASSGAEVSAAVQQRALVRRNGRSRPWRSDRVQHAGPRGVAGKLADASTRRSP